MKLLSNPRATPRHRRREEGGYAILLVLFLATLILLSTMAVAPNILTEGKRQREAEMIWRGKQYIRGIKLFYRKTGKFPTSMDDLVKPKVGNIRFMRQPYKDPMNAKDGEWRLIYVGPTGQLIGSLKPAQTIQLSGIGGAIGAVPGTPASQIGAPSQSIGAGLGQAVGQVFANTSTTGTLPPSSSNPNGQPNIPNGQPASTDSQTPDPNGASAAANDSASESLLASEPTTVMGGNIIGVGSKINQRSIIVYEKAKNYKQFEFIWDPAKDTLTIGGAAGPQIGTPLGQPNPSNPFGNSTNPNGPGSPANPNPPETAPAPPPQP
jgi:hypothetical protein